MKKVVKICALMFIFTIIFNTIYATLGGGLDQGTLDTVTNNNDTIVNKFNKPLNNIFGTILRVLQVVAVAGIVITGVRYMYAGPNEKGQIKQTLIYIIIGTVLVFGTRIVVTLVTNSWNDII